MAEIEHFCDPNDKSHPKFEQEKDTEVMLHTASGQMDGKLPEKWKIGEAVAQVLLACMKCIISIILIIVIL